MPKLILFDNNNNLILTKDNDFIECAHDTYKILDDKISAVNLIKRELVNIKLGVGGQFINSDYYTTMVDCSDEKSDLYNLYPVRKFLLKSEEEMLTLITRARQLAFWDRDNQYCGRCSSKTIPIAHEYSKECQKCQDRFYPRISPCVLVAITHKDKILLGRAPYFPSGVYSLLAGFVEAGETCEETVVREVLEEVGVVVKNIQYFGSQPWPFPHSMMLAFTAEYVSGEINVDTNELEDARWFTIEGLRQCPDLLPAKPSLSRKLLDKLINNLITS